MIEFAKFRIERRSEERCDLLALEFTRRLTGIMTGLDPCVSELLCQALARRRGEGRIGELVLAKFRRDLPRGHGSQVEDWRKVGPSGAELVHGTGVQR